MTELVRTRGQIVVVGIFSDPEKVNLFRVLWRELRVRGARVYEPEDFEKAIQLADSGDLPLDKLISEVYSLERLGEGLEELAQGGGVMKILIQCS
jgi:threonine dehydrogenase-like Zn-dependent dehydrogenase